MTSKQITNNQCHNCQTNEMEYFWKSKQGNIYCLNCNSNNYGDKEPKIDTAFNGSARADAILKRCEDKGLHFTKTIRLEGVMSYSLNNLEGWKSNQVICAYCQTHSYEYKDTK